MESTISALKGYLEPQSVTIIGVSTRTGAGTFNVFEVMLNSGYKGRIFPVNPKGGEILGKKVYRSVAEVPEVSDLAIISIPRTAVLGAVKDCTAKGIKSVAIITQGFADADETGRAMQQELMEAVKGTGTRLVGPNTLGVANLHNNFYSSFLDFNKSTTDSAIVCQSGIFLAASLDLTAGMGLGIDIGNASDIGFNDVLEYFALDEKTRVVNMHMEGIHGGRRFMAIASEASRRKPLLCFKTGRSEAGARAAGSHSGSLAGEDHVFGAAFRQCGVIRVRDVEDMHYLNKTFLAYPNMSGRRIGVVTISGGAGIATMDACADHGLEVADFTGDTLKILNDMSPDWMDVNNPADIWPAGMSRGYLNIAKLSLDTVLSDPNVDACICITPAYQDPENNPLDISEVIREVAGKHPGKPLAVWIFGPSREKFRLRLESEGNVVVYPSPDRAARSLAMLCRYHTEIKNRPAPGYETLGEINTAPVSELITGHLADGPVTVNEPVLDMLGAYGIPAVVSRRAANLEEALALAGDIGYPVALKIISRQISHKSDVGGVSLNIRDEAALQTAYRQMLQRVKSNAPGAAVEGVLVQSFRPEGVEVILGIKRDPEFGPVVIFGLGGIYAELFRDVAFRIAPFTREEALAMLRETKAYKLLAGYRGAAGGNMDAVADCLLRLGQLALEHPEIKELDINPLMVTPGGALAVDARAVLEKLK
ncbi:acetyl-CoA synthetase alpha and beta chains [Desulfocucumis palustris]|uniref:Acetyl-CoA synthetase alpha and beta chains n=1 Tax=Desulfocucumis palustris TaxID=1898651 RepID=A0A2L2X8D6_9FIRM|nr:acetate--CoA ligase [Desulfocucumis palustris]GBF32184.1 acetyl-CoA synthetase alpha and beta chains [Desulfocucumis palustris]